MVILTKSQLNQFIAEQVKKFDWASERGQNVVQLASNLIHATEELDEYEESIKEIMDKRKDLSRTASTIQSALSEEMISLEINAFKVAEYLFTIEEKGLRVQPDYKMLYESLLAEVAKINPEIAKISKEIRDAQIKEKSQMVRKNLKVKKDTEKKPRSRRERVKIDEASTFGRAVDWFVRVLGSVFKRTKSTSKKLESIAAGLEKLFPELKK